MHDPLVKVESCAIGIECIKKIQRRLPDLLIVEAQGSRSSTNQFIRFIRSFAPRGALKIAAWVEDEEPGDAEQFTECGADLIWSPPSDHCKIDFGALLPSKVTKANNPRRVGNLIVDSERYRVWCDERTLVMSPKQVQLLNLFVDNDNKVLTKSDIRKLLNINKKVQDASIKAAVIRLRNILYETGCDVHIRTISGVGYILELVQ